MPLSSLAPRSCKLKQIAEQLSRALGDDDRVRLGNALQPCRKVRRLADNAALLRLARSDQIADYDQARWQCRHGFAAELAAFNALDRCDQLQPGPYRPLGVVLMRLRIAEIDQHAVAHVLRYEPAEALHSLGDALLIGGNDLA